MKSIPILVLGCGGVGRQLLEHIVNCRPLHSQQGLALRVVGVCDSRSLLAVDDVATKGINDSFLTEICRAKSSGSSLSSLLSVGQCQIFKDSEVTDKVIDIAGLLGRSTGLAVVDCSASSETVNILKQAVGLGCCIVLANKKPLTCGLEDYEKLISNFRRIRFESTIIGRTFLLYGYFLLLSMPGLRVLDVLQHSVADKTTKLLAKNISPQHDSGFSFI